MRRKREYSKIVTTILVTVFTALAVFFAIFVCYEMHIQENLEPVQHMAGPILGIPAAIVAFYMWRAKAKSKSDLEWEKTKQLTKFREKHPEYFTRVNIEDDTDDITGGGLG